MTLPAHKTKIVATIGPACDAPETLEQMVRAGLNVARLNFSHGTFDEHARRIATLRAAAAAVGRDLAIMADLPGPKMRIGQLVPEPFELVAGDPFVLTRVPSRATRGRCRSASRGCPRSRSRATCCSSTTASSSSR